MAAFVLVPLLLLCFLAWLGFRSVQQQRNLKALRDELQTLRADMEFLRHAMCSPQHPATPEAPHAASTTEDIPSDTRAPRAFPSEAAFAITGDVEHSPPPATEGGTRPLSPAPPVPPLPPLPDAQPSPVCAQAAAEEWQAGSSVPQNELSAPEAATDSSPPSVVFFGPLQVIWGWLRANPLLYGGLVCFITGIAFAVSYLASRGFFTFSLEARLTGIALVGIGTLLVGHRVSRRSSAYGAALMGGGAIILYLVLFAGAKWGLLSAVAALGIMVLLVAAVVFLALVGNMEILAALASLGGFAAPLLLSTGSGNHVGLFTFYALLCAGNVALLRFKAWDIPVLIGYAMTTGVGALWSKKFYVPSMYLEIQLFSIVFFVLFTIAGLLLSLHADTMPRTGKRRRNVIHASLLFGVPLMMFGIQYLLVRDTPYALASCALCMATWYLVLTTCLMRRAGAASPLARDTYLINALGFSVLAVPFIVDATWTTSVWALQGLGMVWLGLRRKYAVARLCGYLMQGLAALAFFYALAPTVSGSAFFTAPTLTTWGQRMMGHLLLTASAGGMLLLHVRYHGLMRGTERRMLDFWQIWFLTWYFIMLGDSVMHFWAGNSVGPHVALISFSLSAFLFHWLGQRLGFRLWRIPLYCVLPLLVCTHFIVFLLPLYIFKYNLLYGLLKYPFLEWILWDGLRYAWFMTWAGTVSLWTGAVVMVSGFRTGAFAAGKGRTRGLKLFTVFMLCALFSTVAYPSASLRQVPLGPSLALALLLALSAWATAYAPRAAHRVHRLITADDLTIATHAGGLLMVGLAAWVFIAQSPLPGVGPVPYIPLLSITDMTQLLSLGSAGIVLCSMLHMPNAKIRKYYWHGLALAGFVFMTLSLARTVSWYAFLSFDAQVLMRSPLFLMLLSLLWGSLALILIVTASRWTGSRTLWLTGGALLCLTVIKMLLFDMADSGTVTRIISFIFMGVLMLFLGYYCPLPPQTAPTRQPDTPAA